MEFDEKMAIIRAANPAENGPVLRIDISDPGVIQRLTELKKRVEKEIPPLNHYEAPEMVNDKVHLQLPRIVDALIAHGTVYLWTLSRTAPSYPYATRSFCTACDLVAQVEGVEEIPPTPTSNN